MIVMFRNTIKINGLIYEDELADLSSVIDVLESKCVGKRIINGNEINVYEITIYKHDQDLLKTIMSDAISNEFKIRKR